MRLYQNLCYGGLLEQRDLVLKIAKYEAIPESDRQELLGLHNMLQWLIWGFEHGYHPMCYQIHGTDSDFMQRAKNEPRKTIGRVPKNDPLISSFRKA